MAKARMLGMKTAYIPNRRPDIRFIKKQTRNREREAVWGVKASVQKEGNGDEKCG